MFFRLVLAKIDEVEREPIASLCIDRFRDAQSSRVGQRFQARSDVHAVAHEIVTLDDDIAEIDADTKPQAAGLRDSGVLSVEFELDLGRAPNRLHGAGELGDDAVASAPEHPPLMLRNQPVNDLAMRPQGRKRPFLVPACQTAVTNCIGGEDGGHSALNAIQGATLPRFCNILMETPPSGERRYSTTSDAGQMRQGTRYASARCGRDPVRAVGTAALDFEPAASASGVQPDIPLVRGE